jgi:ABC-type xylose transport system substrate-binding protein
MFMCGTVRAKRTLKVKATPRVVSIMVSMDEETRHRFTERANQVAEIKEAARQEKKTLRLAQERTDNQGQDQQALKKQQNKGISYWLFSASFAEIFKKLVTGH